MGAVKPTFTVDKAGTYVVSLTVNDGTVNSSPDTIRISTINVAPVAADGDALTYSWAFTTKPTDSTAALSDATAVNPTFTADEEGTYVVSLIVNDGKVYSDPDTVIVTVTDDDEAPEVIEKEKVVLTVSGELEDGTKFKGSDTVKVKGKKKDKK